MTMTMTMNMTMGRKLDLEVPLQLEIIGGKSDLEVHFEWHTLTNMAITITTNSMPMKITKDLIIDIAHDHISQIFFIGYTIQFNLTSDDQSNILNHLNY